MDLETATPEELMQPIVEERALIAEQRALIAEVHDLSGRYPNKARELVAIYDDFARRCDVTDWTEIQRRRQLR